MTQGIGTVRAHFYASFHSGRTSITSGKQEAKPIARETIKKLCNISRHTQRKYEKIARVGKHHNFAIGPQANPTNLKHLAWQKGQALFQLTDQKGKQGPPGITYLAWQLPNQYFGPHTHQPRGQQKRINRKLADLFTKGMTGNGEDMVESNGIIRSKRFYGNGRMAVKAYNQQSSQEDIYWCSKQFNGHNTRFWHCLPGKTEAL